MAQISKNYWSDEWCAASFACLSSPHHVYSTGRGALGNGVPNCFLPLACQPCKVLSRNSSIGKREKQQTNKNQNVWEKVLLLRKFSSRLPISKCVAKLFACSPLRMQISLKIVVCSIEWNCLRVRTIAFSEIISGPKDFSNCWMWRSVDERTSM